MSILKRMFTCLSRACLILAACATCAWAGSVSVLQSELSHARAGEPDGLYLSVTVDFDMPQNLQNALMRGIPLYFTLDFNLSNTRWYWFDKDISNTQLVSRISYSPLTRRFRLSRGGLFLYFYDIKELISSLKTIPYWKVSDKNGLEDPGAYEAKLRFRLDTKQLPLPLQVDIGNNEWELESGWTDIPLGRSALPRRPEP